MENNLLNDYNVSTLCEICQNACGGCSWSEGGVQKPVEGWDAIRNDLYVNHGTVSKPIVFFEESYIVLDCPQYVPDKFADRYPFNRDAAERRARIRIAMAEKMKGLETCDM